MPEATLASAKQELLAKLDRIPLQASSPVDDGPAEQQIASTPVDKSLEPSQVSSRQQSENLQASFAIGAAQDLLALSRQFQSGSSADVLAGMDAQLGRMLQQVTEMCREKASIAEAAAGSEEHPRPQGNTSGGQTFSGPEGIEAL